MDNKTTESDSTHRHLEKMSVMELITHINNEDKTVPYAIEKALPKIETLITQIVEKLKIGGRLFYIGAGTSGRLGIVDASECPPTFGVPHGLVIGIIAGGDKAIRKAVEFAEDDIEQGWKDLESYQINSNDVVIGIAASGSTPYVISAIKKARKMGLITGCITCNKDSNLAQASEFPIEIIVGPEFVTGSTRMKSGTAQKLVLNMISTATMIRLGKVKDNKMVDMTPSNNKLIDRGIKMIMEQSHLNYEEAKLLLEKHGNVRKSLDNLIQ